jgi:hypothetical protein
MRPEPQSFDVWPIAWRASDGPVAPVRGRKGQLLDRTTLEFRVRISGDDNANTIPWQGPAIDLNRVARDQRGQRELHVRQLHTARRNAVSSIAEMPRVPPRRDLNAPSRTVTVNLNVSADEGAASTAGCAGSEG